VLPDLYPGAPVVITGRYRGASSGSVTVSGRAADASWQASMVASPSDHRGLRAVWARTHVRDLEDQYVTVSFADHDALERQIVAVSLEFGVLCRFTAFVAVDDRVVNEGGALHRVTQPVELPQGWRMRIPAAPAAPMFTAKSTGPAPMPRPHVPQSRHGLGDSPSGNGGRGVERCDPGASGCAAYVRSPGS
jgi:Ca-activated chloride channel family protein